MASLEFRLETKDFDSKIRVKLTEDKSDWTGFNLPKMLRISGRLVAQNARAILNETSADPTGQLAGSIGVSTVHRVGASSQAIQVGSDLYYAAWVEEGTGVFGPRGSPIRPRNARFLVFHSRTTGHKVVTSTVKGQPGKHYLRRALTMFNAGGGIATLLLGTGEQRILSEAEQLVNEGKAIWQWR